MRVRGRLAHPQLCQLGFTAQDRGTQCSPNTRTRGPERALLHSRVGFAGTWNSSDTPVRNQPPVGSAGAQRGGEGKRIHRAFSLVASRCRSRPSFSTQCLSADPLPWKSGRRGLVEAGSRWRFLWGFRATGSRLSGESRSRTGTEEAGSGCCLYVKERHARSKISVGVTSSIVEGTLGL